LWGVREWYIPAPNWSKIVRLGRIYFLPLLFAADPRKMTVVGQHQAKSNYNQFDIGQGLSAHENNTKCQVEPVNL
jgi:hypothetical protein